MNRLYGYVPGYKISITCVSGFLATHVLRTVMHRYWQAELPLKNEALRLTLATLFTAALAAILKSLAFYYFSAYHVSLTSFPFLLRSSIDYLVLVVPWTLLYWGHRVVIRNRRQAGELRRLRWQLEQMQTRAGALGISIEGLMEEIGRIRPLIDENPDRARREITAFSRLLREGFLE